MSGGHPSKERGKAADCPVCQNSHDPSQSPGGKGSLMPLKEGPGLEATAVGGGEKTFISPKLQLPPSSSICPAARGTASSAPLFLHLPSQQLSPSPRRSGQALHPQSAEFIFAYTAEKSTATPGLTGLEKYHLASVQLVFPGHLNS